jgi:hypothetical protein
MGRQIKITWSPEPAEKDFSAVESYLGLLYGKKSIRNILRKLKAAKISQFKAKDIFRASGLSLLGVSNSHVEKVRKTVQSGNPLSPILLVRDKSCGCVIIADGYHRMCAAYSFNEDEVIHCRIV